MHKNVSRLLTSCLLIVLLLNGCNQRAAQTDYNWGNQATSNLENTNMSDISITMDNISVGGIKTGFGETIQYNGSPLEFTFSITHKMNRSANMRFVCFIDGKPQPFTLKNDTESRMSNVYEWDKEGSQEISLSVDPIMAYRDHAVRLEFYTMVNYDSLHSESTKDTEIITHTSNYNYSLIASDQLMQDKEPDQEKILSIDDPCVVQKDLSYYLDENTYKLLQPDEFVGKMPFTIYAEGNQQEQSYYIEHKKGSGSLHMAFATYQEMPKKRRMMLFVGEQPVAAFDGNYYLEWESTDASKRYDIVIPDECLPWGTTQNFYLVPVSIENDKFDSVQFYPTITVKLVE